MNTDPRNRIAEPAPGTHYLPSTAGYTEAELNTVRKALRIVGRHMTLHDDPLTAPEYAGT